MGDYIEVEYQGDGEQEINNILNELECVLEEFGANITNEDHEGYAIRLIRKNQSYPSELKTNGN